MNENTRTVTRLLGVVAFMGGMAWAAVPLYDWFCSVTGFGGTTAIAETGSDEILDETITIKFDASLERGMPWEFQPVQHEMEVRIGETGLAFYEAYNPTNAPVAGQASYNVAPYAAGGFFMKIDCFCFVYQVLQPGERVTMPVSFFVDPEIVEDAEGKYVPHITLSYTFHVTDIEEDTAMLTDSETVDVN